MQLATPSLDLIPSFIAALREGKFSPMQLSFGRTTPDAVEKDPKGYLAFLHKAAPFEERLGDQIFHIKSHEILWIREETRFIGAVSLRYEADAALLNDVAGHIGMAIRPGLVNRGLGIRALRQGGPIITERFLDHGLSSVIAVCNARNRSSRRLIEYFGGQLERERPDVFAPGTALFYRLSFQPVKQRS